MTERILDPGKIADRIEGQFRTGASRIGTGGELAVVVICIAGDVAERRFLRDQ